MSEQELVFFGINDETLPNLDWYTDPKDLAAFREECKVVEAALANLRSYAEAKQHAMELRLRGFVMNAERFERAAESVYARLPSWAKW